MARRSTREQRGLLDWFSWENCLRQDKLWKVLKLLLETGTRWQPFRTLCVAPQSHAILCQRTSERIRIGQRKVQQEFEVSERCCSWVFGDDSRTSPTTLGPPISTAFDVSSRREVGQSGCSFVDRGHNPTTKTRSPPEAEWRGERPGGWRCGSESRGPYSCSTIGSSSGRSHSTIRALNQGRLRTEADPETTIVSFDGVSAFDLISREAMINGLLHVDGGSAVLPFARLFYGRPSQYLWEDATGTTHIVQQGEGGEQGDPLMPLLCSVGRHRALEGISRELLASEKLLAYLDGIYVITRPDRVGDVHTAVRQNLWIHACVSINNGKTKVWNAAGHKPAGCEVLDTVAQAEDPDARVWRGPKWPLNAKVCCCWDRPLATLTSWLPSFRRFQRNMGGSLHTSQACPMFKRLGSCWSTARTHGRTTC